jgi:hypothetical protein
MRTADATVPGGRLVVGMAGAGSESDAPQLPQNLKGGSFSVPHLEHRSDKPAPHSPQYFLPDGFSVPHFAQRTVCPPNQDFQAEYRD